MASNVALIEVDDVGVRGPKGPASTSLDTTLWVTDTRFGLNTGTGNNDRNAIQACVDEALTTGATVIRFPTTAAGYNLSSSVTIAGGELLFVGEGDLGTKGLINVNFNGPGFVANGSQIKFRYMGFSCPDKVAYPLARAVTFAKTSNSDDVDAYFDDCYVTAFNIGLDHVGRGLHVSRSLFSVCNEAINLDWPASGTEGTGLQALPYGFRGHAIQNNRFHSCGLAIRNKSASIIQGAVISGNLMDAGRAFWSGAIQDSVFADNVLKNLNTTGYSITGGGHFVSIVGGVIHGNDPADPTVEQATQAISFSTGGAVRGINISGVGLRWIEQSGMVFTHDVTDSVISATVEDYNISNGADYAAVKFVADIFRTQVRGSIGVKPVNGYTVYVGGAVQDNSVIDVSAPNGTTPTIVGAVSTLARVNMNDGSRWENGIRQLVLRGSKTHDFGSLAAGAFTSTTVTVTGAALGDQVTSVSLSIGNGGILLNGYVSAANTVAVFAQNATAGAVDLASCTMTVLVAKQY